MTKFNDTAFSLGSFSIAGGPPFAALVIGDRLIGIRALHEAARELQGTILGSDSMLTILESWDANLPLLKRAANELASGALTAFFEERSAPIGAVRTHPPVVPRQIFCAGANYRKHVIQITSAHQTMSPAEAERMVDDIVANGQPYVWAKLPSSVTGPYDQVELPATTTKPDWELELAVILGRAARHVRRENALDYVAGYCIANDLTSRDLVPRTDLRQVGSDWLRGKSSPGFLPLGPHLVPAAFVRDPHNLQIILKHNGKVMQDECTADLIHNVPVLIEYISRYVQLWPGDVICTGSPAGNGMHFGVFLKPDDIVDGSITGLGCLRNTFVEERRCAKDPS